MSEATPAVPRDGTVLAFDVGMRRIGVAVGSPFGAGARGVAVVAMLPQGADWNHVERLCREWRPRGMVVGDPMALDGGDQPIRKAAQAFARELRRRTGLPVAMVDERNSSQEAAQRFAGERAAGRSRRKDADLLDAVAAAVILDRWLASPDDGVAVG